MELGKFGVTSLASYEFRGCTNLIKADLSKIRILNGSSFENCINFAGDGNGDLRLPSLTTIGNHAFGGYQNVQCSGLDRVLDLGSIVTLPDGVNAYSGVFRNQINLTEVHLPETLTTIGSRCFELCSSLTDINLPSSLIRINEGAFNGCTSLNIVIDTPNLEFLGPNAFCNYGNKIGSLQGIENLGKITDIKNASDYRAGCFRNHKNLTYAKLPNTLTTIGSYAFYGCSALASVNFPSSLTTIEYSAFDGCSSLEIADLSLPNLEKVGTYAFSHVKITKISNLGKLTSLQNLNWDENIFGDKTTLTSVNLPSTLTSIGKYVFMDYSSLESVTFPSSLTSIGQEAFNGCTSLVIDDLALPNLTSIGNLAFKNVTIKKVSNLGKITNLSVPQLTFGKQDTLKEFHIPSSVTSCNSVSTFEGYTNTKFYADWSKITVYNNFTFKNCQALEIQAPDLVNVIKYGDSTFMNCHIIGELSMPNLTNTLLRFNGYNSIEGDLTKVLNLGIEVTTLGTGCFYNNPNLTEVNLPPQLTTISKEAFAKCSSLAKINFPAALTTIESYAFNGCTSLEIENLVLPNLTSIGLFAFNGAKINKISNLGKLTSLQDINGDQNIFGDKTTLTSVTLPSTLTSVGNSVFRGCSSLSSVSFPSSLTRIGINTFMECSSLTNITLPSSLVTIGRNAFNNCISLEIADLSLPNLEELGSGAFTGVRISKISNLGKLVSINPDNSREPGLGDRSILKEVILPNTIKNIGDFTFCNYPALKTITIESGASGIKVGSYAFADLSSSVNLNVDLGAFTILGNGAFKGAKLPSEVTFPNVTQIHTYAFLGTPISKIKLPSVETMDAASNYEGIFSNCPNLVLVDIGENCTSIGSNSFGRFIGSTGNDITIIVRAVTPPSLGGTLFYSSNISVAAIYVPNASVNEYKAATNWATYEDKIKSLSEYVE